MGERDNTSRTRGSNGSRWTDGGRFEVCGESCGFARPRDVRAIGWPVGGDYDCRVERGASHANAGQANQPARPASQLMKGKKRGKKKSGSASDTRGYTHTPFRGRRRLGLCVRSPPSASPARAPACEREVGSEWCSGRREVRGRDTARGGHTHAHARAHIARLSGTCPPQTWIREKGKGDCVACSGGRAVK